MIRDQYDSVIIGIIVGLLIFIILGVIVFGL